MPVRKLFERHHAPAPHSAATFRIIILFERELTVSKCKIEIKIVGANGPCPAVFSLCLCSL